MRLHDSKGRVVWLVRNAWGGDRHIVVKRFRPRKPRDLLYAVRRTKATREWRNLNALMAAGFPMPEPIAKGDERVRGRWRQSYVLLEAIWPMTTLLEFLWVAQQAPRARRILERVAIVVARMHAAGILYDDLHSNNILLRGRGATDPHLVASLATKMRQFRHRSQRIDLLSLMENDGGEEPADAGVREFFFIDVDRVRRLPSVRGRLCQGDLTLLNCSLCTPIRFRIRFLRAYLKERGIPIAETRRWASAIDRKTWAKWKRDPHLAGRAFMTYAGSPTRSEPPRS